MLFEERSRAESFGAVAELYDRVRPSYPPALLDDLLADGAVDVLDVGCGTGIAAALLAARGCSVLGVEIDARMAQLAGAKGLTVEVARFERWNDAGRRFDLLTAGQAWHWVEPRIGAEKAARVLRHGGRVALFWNLGEPPPVVRERLMPIYERLEPDLGNSSIVLGHLSDPDRGSPSGLIESGCFDRLSVRRFPWHKSYDTAEWLGFLQTHSDHHALPPDRRAGLLNAVGEALDGLGGRFEMKYEAVLVSGRRV